MKYTYEAEHRALGKTRVFTSQEEATEFATEIAFRYDIPLTTIGWLHGNAQHGTAYTNGRVDLPNNEGGRSVGVILHELAHVWSTDIGHGTVWYGNFRYLVRNEIGFMQAAALDYECSH
jgi:hypothetical protein